MHVHAGQHIGFLGNSGNAKSTGPHLHFELKDTMTGAIVNSAPSLRVAMKLSEPSDEPLEAITLNHMSRAEYSRSVRAQYASASRKGGRRVRVGESTMSYRNVIETYSQQYNVDPALVAAVIQQESQGDPMSVSRVGAMGLMQLMPTTCADMGVDDPYNPEENIRGGVKYLSQQLHRFGGSVEKALIAYNAGPGRVNNGAWMQLKETRAYIPAVLKFYRILKDVHFTTSTPDGMPETVVMTPSKTPPSTKDLDQMLESIRTARGEGPLGAVENATLDAVASKVLAEGMDGKGDLRSKATKWATKAGYQMGVLNAICFSGEAESVFPDLWSSKGPLAGRYLGLAHGTKNGHHFWAVVLDAH